MTFKSAKLCSEIILSNIRYTNYTESIIAEAFRTDNITRETRERIKNEFAEIVGENIDRYSGGFSCSLPADKGEEIIESVLYVIDSLLISKASNSAAIGFLKDVPLKTLYYEGIRLVRSYVFKAAGLLVKVKKLRVNTHNIDYNDTIDKKIRVILSHYDVFYGAHKLPGYPSYKTTIMPNKLRGILFLLRYLQNLYCENTFCLKFDSEEIQELENESDCGENIFFSTLVSSIVSYLGQGDVDRIYIHPSVKNKASSEMKKLSEAERRNKIIEAAVSISSSESNFVSEYIRKCAERHAKKIAEAIRTGEPLSANIYIK